MEEKFKRLLKRPKERKIQSADYLSSGSSMLNLACSGNVHGGLIKGRYFYYVGSSSSGKTWLCMACFAEACRNKHFDDYRLIYDNAEDGALMDWERFFGSKVAQRVEPPGKSKDGSPIYSTTVEEFYFRLDDVKVDGRPCIYILDSMDALSDEAEQAKMKQKKKSAEKGEEAAGSYGLAKAKANSQGIRQFLPFLRKTGSILLLVSQTRDNINRFSFDKETRAGGRALTFYAALEMWTSQAGHIKKKVRGKDRELGIFSKIRVKKNRIQGKDRTVTVPIRHSSGIDDVGSCVDYLIEESHWSKDKSGQVTAPEFDFAGSAEKLIQHIESNDLELQLLDIVQDVWDSVEKACSVPRKRRYE